MREIQYETACNRIWAGCWSPNYPTKLQLPKQKSNLKDFHIMNDIGSHHVGLNYKLSEMNPSIIFFFFNFLDYARGCLDSKWNKFKWLLTNKTKQVSVAFFIDLFPPTHLPSSDVPCWEGQLSSWSEIKPWPLMLKDIPLRYSLWRMLYCKQTKQCPKVCVKCFLI